MMREGPQSALTRDVLGCTMYDLEISHGPREISSTQYISPLGKVSIHSNLEQGRLVTWI